MRKSFSLFLIFSVFLASEAYVAQAYASARQPLAFSRNSEDNELLEIFENNAAASAAGTTVKKSDSQPGNTDKTVSPGGEEQYVQTVKKWLDSLEPKQRELVRKILRDAHPVMHDLRLAIRDKKSELATLSFGSNTKPDILPRIGMELQKLRADLRHELQKVSEQLKKEANIVLRIGSSGLWLVPPSANTVPPVSSTPDSALHIQANAV